MRSNDMLWGASAVNIFNFTFVQEYFAAILGMEIGSYYHIANNFHYYEDKRDMLKSIASVTDYADVPYEYEKRFHSLEEFDNQVKLLSEEEKRMRLENYQYQPDLFEDEFFRDWYLVLVHKNHKEIGVDYLNPILKSALHNNIYNN